MFCLSLHLRPYFLYASSEGSDEPVQLSELSLLAYAIRTKIFLAEYRGSCMSAHVLLILLNELGKRDKMRGLPSILSLFRNEFNKFNNTRARMLDSIYHMTNTLNL